MPQNTPMKRQFTTIDGRTVMSNLPQHWGGNDWTITGVDNPLPVGNYVQTEAGVWIPQKGSDDGAADVRLTGSKVENVLSRKVRTSNANNNNIIVPHGVKGMAVEARVYSATGSFGAGQGLQLVAYGRPTSWNHNIFELRNDAVTSPSVSSIVIYPNEITSPDVGSNQLKISNFPLMPRYRIDLSISGSFAEGQGIDCDLNVIWLY